MDGVITMTDLKLVKGHNWRTPTGWLICWFCSMKYATTGHVAFAKKIDFTGQRCKLLKIRRFYYVFNILKIRCFAAWPSVISAWWELVAMNFIVPLILGMSKNPNWRSRMFQRGGPGPPTSVYIYILYILCLNYIYIYTIYIYIYTIYI